MNASSSDERLQTQVRDGHEACEEDAAELVELGKVTDTQGGFLGVKYDSAVGWMYY